MAKFGYRGGRASTAAADDACARFMPSYRETHKFIIGQATVCIPRLRRRIPRLPFVRIGDQFS